MGKRCLGEREERWRGSGKKGSEEEREVRGWAGGGEVGGGGEGKWEEEMGEIRELEGVKGQEQGRIERGKGKIAKQGEGRRRRSGGRKDERKRGRGTENRG